MIDVSKPYFSVDKLYLILWNEKIGFKIKFLKLNIKISLKTNRQKLFTAENDNLVILHLNQTPLLYYHYFHLMRL